MCASMSIDLRMRLAPALLFVLALASGANAILRGFESSTSASRSFTPPESSAEPLPPPFLAPVTLRLVDGDFVDLPSGNPAKVTRLRLDFASDALVLYEPLAQRSQTFALFDDGADGISRAVVRVNGKAMKCPGHANIKQVSCQI